MTRSNVHKLNIQMVPFPLWGKNLRAVMPRSAWRALRLTLLERQGLICESCGKGVSESKQLKAHEEWAYLEQTGEKLLGFGESQWCASTAMPSNIRGALNAMIAEGSVTERARVDTIAHFCTVNGATERIWHERLKSAYFQWSRRSKHCWRIDYGPFTGWMAAKFTRDPLNDRPWDSDLEVQWAERDLPSMVEIVDSFPEKLGDQLPGSYLGRWAWNHEQKELAKTAERRRKAAKKRESAKRKAKRMMQTHQPHPL